MIRVAFGASAFRDLAGGLQCVDVEAHTVRALIQALDERFPGMGDAVARKAAIAIDGEIHQDALFEALPPGAEVYLIPRIGGG
ncbi:MAG TPA: MoaD/ThiS family protein [Caulobacteraceae bacterium]|jgi:molybdopterin converting factor small subunit|nr:MoaD/ThiS family protein [Caulobacteraceae bacterium]